MGEDRSRVVAVLVVAVIGVVLALLAAACSGGGTSAADQELIDALAESINVQQGAAVGGPTAEMNRCMAESIVGGLGGAEKLESSFGVTAGNASQAVIASRVEVPAGEAISLADDIIEGCDVLDVTVSELAGTFGEDAAVCWRDAIDVDDLRDNMAAPFMTEADAAEVFETSQQNLVAALAVISETCGLQG